MAAILGVTVMFQYGKLHTLVIQSTTLLVLFLQTLTWTGTYSIDEVCNFPLKYDTSITLTFLTENVPFELENASLQT